MRSLNAITEGPARGPILGALGLMGLSLAVAAVRRAPRRADPAGHLTSYLLDHLAGSDAAIRLVVQLSHTLRGTAAGELFSSLHAQFEDERRILRELLAALGSSDASMKRLAGAAAGTALRAAGVGQPGTLPFFLAIEGLAIGIQGKRCLWRALPEMRTGLRGPAVRSFAGLEADALRQWEEVDRYRRSLVLATFPLERQLRRTAARSARPS